MRCVAVTGPSGFVGRALIAHLIERGDSVVALTRRPDGATFPPGVSVRALPDGGEPDPSVFDGVDAIVHLAGEPVSGRWTPAKKKAIRDSRVDGTRVLVRALAKCNRRPRALISASASGYYGSRYDETVTEASPPGSGFLASVCVDWEREAMAARDLGVRVVCLRTGIVLGPGGGALSAMLPPFRAGLGGPFGGGRQFFPWITRDDLVALYALALDRDDLVGPVNAVTPDYATNARFAQALGNALGRPAVFVVPAFALRPLLGEFGQTLLESQLMLPAVAEDAGFVWKFPHLEDALLSVLGSKRRTNVRRFESEQLVKADLETVFEFFSSPGNLEAITPPTLGFNIERRPAQMQRGAQIAYTLRIRGIGVKWTTLIARWDPRQAFVDVQLHGPYALWRHRHTFEPASGGVRIRDAVDYILPFAPFGNIAAGSVRRDIESIFAYRSKVIESRFG